MKPNAALAGAAMSRDQADLLRQKIKLDEVRRNLSGAPDKGKKLKEACQGFETIFLNKIWQQMRKSVNKDDLMHSKEEEAYLSMFDTEMAKKMSEAGGIGLGNMLYAQLKDQLTQAGGITTHISMPKKPEDLNALRPDPRGRDLNPLRPETEAEPDVRVMNPLDNPSAAAGGDAMARAMRLADALENRGAASGTNLSGAAVSGTPVSSLAAASADPADAERSPVWPMKGRVSSGYGWRTSMLTGGREWHPGVDIEAEAGSKVAACADGRVIFSGDHTGYGRLVIVEHAGGWRSFYGHGGKSLVREGDEVQAGRKIAELGDNGRSQDTHLHFEIRRNGRAHNPNLLDEIMQPGMIAQQISKPEPS